MHDEHIVGELHFEQAGRPVCAALHDDLHWRCDDQALEDYLNRVCRPKRRRWEVHRPEIHTLYQVAERLGAEVRLPQPAGSAVPA
jgi:hypothetical protein